MNVEFLLRANEITDTIADHITKQNDLIQQTLDAVNEYQEWLTSTIKELREE